MKVKGTLLFVIFAALLMVGASFFMKKSEAQSEAEVKKEQQQNAKARIQKTDLGRFKGKIRIGLDNFLGYYPLRSKRLQTQMLHLGYKLEYADDNADYAKRAQLLKDGKLDFAVFTVDSYILNAAPSFPGQIVMVISESKGADAIIAKKEIGTINDLEHVTVTLSSPSHQLLKATIIDFGLDELKANIRPASGSTAALADLLSGKTDAAVLWEPEVSTALQDDRFKTLLSTESTSKLIVDILVASDRVVHQEPEKLTALLSEYFPNLRYYANNKDRLSQEFQKDANLSPQAADKVIDTIAWKSLQENASQWFGIRTPGVRLPEFRIIETIDLTNDVLIKFGDFKKSPLPAEGAFKLISSGTLAKLHGKQASGKLVQTTDPFFNRLNPQEWDRLDTVASLRIPPIKFKAGSQEFSATGVENLKNVRNILNRYPRYRLRIQGHTSTRGDAQLNRQLSQQRAAAIRQYLLENFQIPPNRIKAEGHGSDRPLPRTDDEPYRAWLGKLPRVEFHLLEEVL